MLELIKKVKITIRIPITLAIILMAIPGIIIFPTISEGIPKHFLLRSCSEIFTSSIKPGVLSTMFSIILMTSVIVRNNPRKLLKSAEDCIILMEDIIFLASFLNVLCSKEPIPIHGLTISYQSFMLFALILSWLGVRQIIGLIWLAVMILGVMRLDTLGAVERQIEAIYIMTSIDSLIVQWIIYKKSSLSALRTRFLASSILHIFSNNGTVTPHISLYTTLQKGEKHE